MGVGVREWPMWVWAVMASVGMGWKASRGVECYGWCGYGVMASVGMGCYSKGMAGGGMGC